MALPNAADCEFKTTHPSFPMSKYPDDWIQLQLSKLAKAKGQKCVGEKFGVGQTQISRWVNGKSIISPVLAEEIIQFARAEGILSEPDFVDMERRIAAPNGAFVNPFDASIGGWVTVCMNRAPQWKKALAQYAAKNHVHYGESLQIDSGTTFILLMKEILEQQKQTVTNEGGNLVILTTNICVFSLGSSAQQQFVQIFRDMQIILTGGSYLPTLQSLIGTYAAAGIRTDVIMPKVVFVGAAGLCFQNGEIEISYSFEGELSSQEAYATRATTKRIILCDHTKLGVSAAHKAKVSAKAMLETAAECIILSTYPKDDCSDPEAPAHLQRISEQIKGFEEVIKALKEDGALARKNLTLLFVDEAGNECRRISKNS